MTLIALEGNIGAGKSTLIDKLAVLFPDKVGVYKENIEGYNELIKLYYEDKKTYTSAFQIMSINRKFINSIDAMNDPKPIKIIERTLESNRKIFALKQYQDGTSTDKAWREYTIIYNAIDALIPQPDLYIYLKATSPFLYNRIHTKRKRPGEQMITLEYLENVNSRYNKWIEELQSRNENVIIINIFDNLSDAEISEIFLCIFNNIKRGVYNNKYANI